MITYLPDFLPDELFYSYVARYHHESGNISLRQTQSQVYSKIRNYFDISFIGDINDNFYTCSNDILKGLGEMYVCDDRFKKNIDRVGGEGTAEFVREAIFIYCDK